MLYDVWYTDLINLPTLFIHSPPLHYIYSKIKLKNKISRLSREIIFEACDFLFKGKMSPKPRCYLSSSSGAAVLPFGGSGLMVMVEFEPQRRQRTWVLCSSLPGSCLMQTCTVCFPHWKHHLLID